MMIDEQLKPETTAAMRDALPSHSHQRQAQEQRATPPERYRPLIGLPVPVQQSSQGPLLFADALGAWAVERMHGRVLLLPLWPLPTHQHIYQSLWPLLHGMDGLLLPAGTGETTWDEHWKTRASQPGPRTWSISWEIALCQLATFLGMPVLAIGEGAEKWNVALGGTLQKQAPTPQRAPSPPDTWERQIVRVRAKSTLATCIQQGKLSEREDRQPWTLPVMLTPRVEKLAPGLRSCAESTARGIVAFERNDSAFGLGMFARVDWGLEQEESSALFEAFVQASRSFAVVRQQHRGWEASRDTICASISERVVQGQPLLPGPPSSSEEIGSRGFVSGQHAQSS